jgi:hypothetical protein
MRTSLLPLAGLGLLAAAAASAEPAKLSETELGGVAAGQDLGSNFSLSTMEAVTNTTTTTTTTNTNDADTATSVFESSVAAEQSLAGQSSNTISALGMLDSADVSAAGNANAALTGTIANTVP